MEEKSIKTTFIGVCVALVLVIIGIAMANAKNVKSTPTLSVPGSYLEAWNICYPDLLKAWDKYGQDRNLNRYDFEFSEYGDEISIAIAPIQTYEVITFGGGARYWIDKKSMKIARKEFYK